MTVSVPNQLVFSDQGNGVTTVFSYPVRILEASELVVISRENDVDTVLSLDADYTVSGTGAPDGVSITMLYVPSSDETIIRYRNTAAKQIVNLADSARNPAEAVEQQLDRLAKVDQDQAGGLRRAWKSPVGTDGGLIRVGADGDLAIFNEDGDIIGGPNALDIDSAQENAALATAAKEEAEAAQLAAEQAAQEAADSAASVELFEPHYFSIDGDGTAGPYDIGIAVAAPAALHVAVSGVTQIYVDENGTPVDFTVSGQEITFLTITPTVDDKIHGHVFVSRPIGVPSDSSVKLSTLAFEVKEKIPSLSSNAALVDETPQQLKLIYHKARSAWPVKAFGSSLTAVGGGNASVDTAALQAAFDNEQMIDMNGAVLQINDVIDVDYSSANISAVPSGRVGDTASSKIKVVDDALPYVFNATATNFEASGFAILGETTNTTTIAFHYKRPDGSARDIDAVMKDIVVERMAKPFHIYGRGLEVEGATFAEMKTCSGDIDWPSVSTPNGQSNDTDETGFRAFRFHDVRLHGNLKGIRNIGENGRNCRGILMQDIQADIGIGAVFEGWAIESLFDGMLSQLNAVNAGLLFDLYAGSHKSVFSNFGGGGIKTDLVERLSHNMINIRCDADDDTYDLSFVNGWLGPTRRNGVQIFGAGRAYNILFSAVNWSRCGLQANTPAYCPISIFEDGGSFTDVLIKLAACNFDTSDTTADYVVGGTDSAAIMVAKDTLTTKPSALPWAQSNVVLA